MTHMSTIWSIRKYRQIDASGSDRTIPHVRNKCECTWQVLFLDMRSFPPGDAREVGDDPSMKMVWIQY